MIAAKFQENYIFFVLIPYLLIVGTSPDAINFWMGDGRAVTSSVYIYR